MASDDIAIAVKNLTKTYRLFGHPGDRIKQFFSLGLKQYHKEFTALKDVSFEIKRGETVGIIGRNGSGKSTLLQLICGILKPTSGSVQVNGRISALLELGAGFNPEFTGRENVYFQGTLMGFTKAQMDARFDEIAAFADIGEFIEQPVRTYSSGMFVRLAFAVAASVDPDIFVIDEALAVGDTAFQIRCMNRMHELTNSGATILFVSHNTYQVQRMCSRSILLVKGFSQSDGSPSEIIARYESDAVADIQLARRESAVDSTLRFTDIRCDSEAGYFDPRTRLIQVGQSFSILIRYALTTDIPNGLQIGILLKSIDGTNVFGEMSKVAGVDLLTELGEHSVRISFMPNLLLPGNYSCSLSAFDRNYIEQYGFLENAFTFRIVDNHSDPLQRIGSVLLPHEWNVIY